MKIITLIENLVNTENLYAEHGLSLYIETNNRKILFDTGQSGLFLQNAKKLGVTIEDIDCVVLSHGHYDHTGGLYPFLKVNSKARVHAKSEIFTPKYRSNSSFIGTPKNVDLLKGRLCFVNEITELDESVFIMPNIPIIHPLDTHYEGFFKSEGNEMVADNFEDELFITIVQKNQINIVTACSHRGITNICQAATDHFNLQTRLILGGFHMKNCTTEQYIHITHFFRMQQPKSLGVCHCTGIEKYADLYRECEVPLFYNYTGKVIKIGS
jgi:7,8-dihydropterin-6-yl-methyl-4-(beta-D-ribofuranosyl)aminobenzene 5'-phosphate synthase